MKTCLKVYVDDSEADRLRGEAKSRHLSLSQHLASCLSARPGMSLADEVVRRSRFQKYVNHLTDTGVDDVLKALAVVYGLPVWRP